MYTVPGFILPVAKWLKILRFKKNVHNILIKNI